MAQDSVRYKTSSNRSAVSTQSTDVTDRRMNRPVRVAYDTFKLYHDTDTYFKLLILDTVLNFLWTEHEVQVTENTEYYQKKTKKTQYCKQPAV